MKGIWASAAFVVALGGGLWAQGAPGSPTGPEGPDLSGRWNRDSVSGRSDGGNNSGWGPRVEIDQSGANVTVLPISGSPERYKTDGTETARVLSVDGCKSRTRITKAVTSRDRLTITTWLVEKPACLHGEVDNEPIVNQTGDIEVRRVRGGLRKLESISVLSREGDTLTVETTRATEGGAPTTTTTIYRR